MRIRKLKKIPTKKPRFSVVEKRLLLKGKNFIITRMLFLKQKIDPGFLIRSKNHIIKKCKNVFTIRFALYVVGKLILWTYTVTIYVLTLKAKAYILHSDVMYL